MSEPSEVRKRRPWYLIATMCLMWIIGVFGATSGCSEVSYLRGSHEMQDDLQRGVDEATHPLVRMELIRQQARLSALAGMYRRAFPLSAGRMLLCLVLVLAAGSAIAGRAGARSWALQAVLANAVLAAVSFVLMTPVRHSVAEVVAEDAVTHMPAGGVPGAGQTREQAFDFYRRASIDSERLRAGLELCMFAIAGIALTRRRTKAWFSALEHAVPDPEDGV